MGSNPGAAVQGGRKQLSENTILVAPSVDQKCRDECEEWEKNYSDKNIILSFNGKFDEISIFFFFFIFLSL